MTAMLVVATGFATGDNAFADNKRYHDKKGGYGKSQTTSQANDCGNGNFGWGPFFSIEGGVSCQNIASQIQGQDNEAGLTSTQESAATDTIILPTP